MQKSDDVVLVEAEQDIRELEQHIADQHILIKKFDASGKLVLPGGVRPRSAARQWVAQRATFAAPRDP